MEPEQQNLITARGLRKAFRNGEVETQVLRGVDLDVPTGSFAVLLGPSGCGKTTLLNLIGALDSADGGDLTVAGVALGRASPKELAQYRRAVVGPVFQFYNLLPTLTVQENVEVVLEPLPLSRGERQARAQEMLAEVGLAAMRDKFPGQLSGGEQQRVAIARALAKHPRLVIADEPTGSLDRKNSRQVVELMHRLNRQQGITFFVVTHDPEVAEGASLIVHMEDGAVLRCERRPRAAGSAA